MTHIIKNGLIPADRVLPFFDRFMTPTLILLNIIGGVCLMLYGLRQIRRGLMRGFGADLRRFVSACTGNRITGFFAGLVATLVLQSSTAVTMILATFVGQKMLTTAAALAVVLGADVGTTIVAQIMTFDLSWVGPLLLLIGLMIFSSFEQHTKLQSFGLATFGLGLMLFALGWIKTAGIPLKESEALPYLMKPLEIDPVLTLVVGVILTWLFHSSLAFVLLVVSFCSLGVISLHLALLLVLGANIGGVMAPLIASLRDEPAAMRIPFANLIMRLVLALLMLPYMNEIAGFLKTYDPDIARDIVHFHTGFNVILAVLFLPLTGRMARIVHYLIPERKGGTTDSEPLYLDYKQMETPVVALSSAARETLRMADMVQDMLVRTLDVFQTGSESAIRKIQDRDTSVDHLHRAIKHYMAKTMEMSLDEREVRRHLQILDFATTLEHIGDAIDKSMMPMATRMIRDHKKFSPAGMAEIENLFQMAIGSLRMAQTVLMSSDQQLARKLVEDKEKVRQAEKTATANHFVRLREGRPETIETSSIHLDLIRDLQRINADVVSVAYPILEETGELLRSRLVPPRIKDVVLPPDQPVAGMQ